jgi:hypothetical protein
MHSTDNLDDGYLGSGKILGYSIGKHGRENHKKEILKFCKSRDELKLLEATIVNEELLADPLCINLKYGGEGGQTSAITKATWEQPGRRDKQVVALKKCWEQDDYRLARSEESSRTMKQKHAEGKIRYDTFTGRKHSEETKMKMRETRRLKREALKQ